MASSDSIFSTAFSKMLSFRGCPTAFFPQPNPQGTKKCRHANKNAVTDFEKCRHGFQSWHMSHVAYRRWILIRQHFWLRQHFVLKFEKMPSVWRKCRQLEENAVTFTKCRHFEKKCRQLEENAVTFTKCRQFEKNAVSSQQIVISRKHDTGSQEILTHQVHLSSKRRNAYHITFAISTRTM